MEVKEYGSTKQVLGIIANKVALGALVSGDGVTANAMGQKIIPAGTPVGGDKSTLVDEQTVLKVSNDAKAQGVLEHEVNVTAGTANATLIINGYINENRLPSGLSITAEAKTALNGKVTFFRRNA